jgi:formate transporter
MAIGPTNVTVATEDGAAASTSAVGLDALLPPAMTAKAENLGVSKVGMGAVRTFVLAVLTGAFIGLGAMFATVVSAAAAGQIPFGAARLLAGLAFCLGLILVVVGGAELFTGNNLIVMAWADRRVSLRRLLRNWGLVYAGNLAGGFCNALVCLAIWLSYSARTVTDKILAILFPTLRSWPPVLSTVSPTCISSLSACCSATTPRHISGR